MFVGEARAVDLLVVQDVDLGAAVLLHERGERGALDRVLRDDARVGALAGRVVLVRLARLGARPSVVRPTRRVGRGDLRDAGLVEDRDRDRRGARVELAEVTATSSRPAPPCGRSRRRRPASTCRPRGRVVERHVLDVESPALPPACSSASFTPLTTASSAGARRPAAAATSRRQVLAAAPTAAAAAAAAVVAAAGGDAERERGRQGSPDCQRT